MNKSLHIALFLIVVSLLSSSAASAQRLPFKNYTTADGLPGPFVRDIIQDKYGYIWLNTDGGVAQFDGVEFKNYTAEDSLSYIFRDSSDYLYLSGPTGLWRMAGDERVFHPIRKNLGPIKKAIYTRDGTLWFCHGQAEMGSIKHAGLSRISKDQLEEYPDTMLDSLGTCQLLKIFEDYRGNFWLRLWSMKLNKDVWRRFSNGVFTEAVKTSHSFKDWRIRDIAVDRYGSTWLFASKRVGEKWMQGTFKFAKARWTEYSGNTGLLLSKGILDDEGNLWLIARRYERSHKSHHGLGVVKAVEDTLHWFTEKQGLVSNKVHYTAKGRNGALWFVTKNGASKYQNGKFQTIVADFGWSETSVDEVVFEDSKGKVWFLWHTHTAKSQEAKIGIAVYADGQIKNYTSKHGIFGEHWVKKLLPLDTDEETFIWEDNRGHIWFQTDKALFHASNGKLQRYDQKNGLAGPLLLSWDGAPFLQDREGNIWIGTEAGMSKLADQSYERYTKEDGLTSNFVRSPYQDKKGRIWVKADDQANFMIDKKIEKFSFVTKDIGGFLEDKFGNLYFNTGIRVSKFDGKEVHHFDLPHHAPVFQQDNSGNIWFGECCGNGVSKLDGKKIQHYTAKDGFVNRSAKSIFQDLRGHVWFVGTSGISKFNGNQFSNHKTEINLLEPSSGIYSIDQRKHVWLRDGEILRDLTDPAEPARQLPAMVRQGVTVMTSFWDHEGNNWLGTATGLVKIGKHDFQIFATRDGLPGNRIGGLAQDNFGNIWISTQKGIGVYDGTRVHDYNRAHGLEPIAINGAPFVDKNGNVWFGSMAGLIKVNSAKAFEKTVPPLLYLKSIRIDTLQVSPRGNLKLKHRQNDITFSYLGLSFKNEKAIRYQYCLEGYDEKWSPMTDKREVRYTNLDPGHYVFKAKAISGVGVESEIAAADFTILPPFWKTWWFLTISSLSTLLLGYIGYQRRVNAKLEKARILNELKAAHDMQMGLMPTSDPLVSGFDISGLCKPAEEVGGDYFDYFWLNEEKTKFGIAVVDVSGKAMQGAMTAVMTSGMIYSEIGNSQSPRAILQKINKPMYLKTDRQIFTTMSFAVIDTLSKTLTFSNAGQALPLLKRDGEIQYLKVEGARFPLGIQEKVQYGEATIQLQPGDVVMFYTDGIPEAMNEKNELFDFERLETTIRNLATSIRAAEVIEALVNEVSQFSGAAKQHDDMTVVVVQVKNSS